MWLDASNSNPVFARNRIRLEVLPVLEQLHPGASGRICALSERLAEEEEAIADLTDLALEGLIRAAPVPAGGLNRQTLMALKPAAQRRLLQRWLERTGGPALTARQLEELRGQLEPQRGPGRRSLARRTGSALGPAAPVAGGGGAAALNRDPDAARQQR